MIKKAITTLLLFTAVSAQEPVLRDRTAGDKVFFETESVYGAGVHSLFALYRIRYDNLIFTLANGNQGSSYSAAGVVTVEILDSTGQSISRQISEIRRTSPTNLLNDLRKQYFQGAMTFTLPPGKYSVLLRVEDKESGNRIPDSKRPVELPSSSGSIQSTLFPVQERNASNGEFISHNLGGDVIFSQNFGFVAVHSTPGMDSVRYTISQRDENEETASIISDTVVRLLSFPGVTLQLKFDSSDVRFSVKPESASTVYYIPIAGNLLRQGRYTISIRFEDSSTTTLPFGARWPEMPLSLSDLELATLPLQHLLTREEYSELRRGGRETRIRKFDEFWSRKDPTPGTAYNEMMAEFYRRVDYTVGAFRTLKEPNGSITDRGRIYILYGKPSSTDRVLRPGSIPQEIWNYTNLGKKFIFKDPSRQGNYTLAESQ
ncbi:MAG: GWxTD domain-containing protein [Bacteroidota bacterium]